MVNANNSEQEGKYDILQNAAGEILIIIKYHQGGPENPRFVYDGGSSALLYRSRESAIMLDNINEKARMPLKSVSELLIVEIEDDDVAREYKVPVRHIQNLDKFIIFFQLTLLNNCLTFLYFFYFVQSDSQLV